MAVAPDEKDVNEGSHSKKKVDEKPKFNYSEDLKQILALKIPSPWLKRDLNLFLELSKKHIEDIKREDWSKVAESFCDDNGNCTVNDCLELIKSLREVVENNKGRKEKAFLALTEEVTYIFTMAELGMAELNQNSRLNQKQPLKKRRIIKESSGPPISGSTEFTKNEFEIIFKYVEKNKELFSKNRDSLRPNNQQQYDERLKKLSDSAGKELNRKINLLSILEQMKYDLMNLCCDLSPLDDHDKKRACSETHPTFWEIFDHLVPRDVTKENLLTKEKTPLTDSKDDLIPEDITSNTENTEELLKVADTCEPNLPENPTQADIVESVPQGKKRGRKPKLVLNSEELKKKEKVESSEKVSDIVDAESDVSVPQPKKRGRKPKVLSGNGEEPTQTKPEKPKGLRKNFRQTRGRFVGAYDDEDILTLVEVCVEHEHLFQQDPLNWEAISKKVQEQIDPKKKLNFLAENCEGIFVALKKKFEENKSKLGLKDEPLSRLYDLAEPLLPYVSDSVTTNELYSKCKRERVNTTHFSPPTSPTKLKLKSAESKDKMDLDPVVVLNRHDHKESKMNSLNGKKRFERQKNNHDSIQGVLNYEMNAARLPKSPKTSSSSEDDVSSDSPVEDVKDRPSNHSEPVHPRRQELRAAPGPSTSKRNISTNKQKMSSKSKKKRKRHNRSESQESSSEDDTVPAKFQDIIYKQQFEDRKKKQEFEYYKQEFEGWKSQRLHPPSTHGESSARNLPNEASRQWPELNLPVGQNNAMMPHCGFGYNSMDPSMFMMMSQYQAYQAANQTNQYLHNISTSINALTDIMIAKFGSKKKKEKKTEKKKRRKEEEDSYSSD